MSLFLKRAIVQRGYLAKHPKRLNSVSRIHIMPGLNRGAISYPRGLRNPFDVSYESDILKLLQLDKRTRSLEKIIGDLQKKSKKALEKTQNALARFLPNESLDPAGAMMDMAVMGGYPDEFDDKENIDETPAAAAAADRENEHDALMTAFDKALVKTYPRTYAKKREELKSLKNWGDVVKFLENNYAVVSHLALNPEIAPALKNLKFDVTK